MAINFSAIIALRCSASCFALMLATPAVAAPQQQPTTPSPASQATADTQDIIVTAQKRSESINRVGMSITAASSDSLTNLGISDARDLGKLVTGFTFAETNAASPVYTIRGVGYYESSIAATPAVSVYVDQVPLPYPQMTRNAAFDLERVEVLKGPQGTIFGQNSTGGAVNYIAAKPTSDLHAGFDITGGRFDQADGQAYVSGPITGTLNGRLSIGHQYQGDWQQSYTRPGDTRGKKDISQGRIILDWAPTHGLKFELNATGWTDHSDTQAPQLIARTSNLVPTPGFVKYPLAPANARAADWSPEFPTARNDRFYQISLRGDYSVSDTTTLTSITSYSNLRLDAPVDADGTSLTLQQGFLRGRVSSFNQEGRVQVDLQNVRVTLGGNYSRDRITENDSFDIGQSSQALNAFPPGFPVDSIEYRSSQKVRTLAAFASGEYDLTDRITLLAGARYTDDKRTSSGCIADSGNGQYAAALGFILNNVFRPIIGLPGNVTIPLGGCALIDAQFAPAEATGTLHQHNISWRAGANYKLSSGSLLYINISKGYKAGTFPTIAGVQESSFSPVGQESVLAYEGGLKVSAFDRKVQINGAAFYYDYSNKQIRGKVPDPIFGPLEQLLNVPKARVYGAELQVTIRPLTGLALNGGVTYLNSKVTSSFENFDTYGSPANFQGERFPFTPSWLATFDAQYTIPINGSTDAFIGGNASYNGATTSFFRADVPYNPADPQHINQRGQIPTLPVSFGNLNIDAYTLVDLRAGFGAHDNTWRITVFARNVGDKYYWNNAQFVPGDSTVRYAGMPRSFGATFAYRY